MKEEQVVLVDKNNKKIGTEEKLKAHEDGKLHRAFSVFVFNSNGELLLQQRAKTKYHSGGLWSNTVCSHQRPNETYKHAMHRRLREEMGFDCDLKKLFCFIYKTKFRNDLTEHEYDYVIVGKFDGTPIPNPEEVMSYKWVNLKKLKEDLKKNKNKYTFWFGLALNRITSSQIKEAIK